MVVSSNPGQVAIKWLLRGWVTVCGEVNPSRYVTKVNSAFHPCGVGKSSSGLPGWGQGGTCSSPVLGGM